MMIHKRTNMLPEKYTPSCTIKLDPQLVRENPAGGGQRGSEYACRIRLRSLPAAKSKYDYRDSTKSLFFLSAGHLVHSNLFLLLAGLLRRGNQ